MGVVPWKDVVAAPMTGPDAPQQQVGRSGTARNIVLIFDGTSNTFEPDHSSLPTLFSLLSADPEHQLAYYQTGVGTYETGTVSRIVRAAAKLWDQATAYDLHRHVKQGYAYLMNHYSPGDRIWLYGFSRGAYTARALAGMLQQCGLLLPGNEESVNLAYKIYSSPADEELSTSTKLAAAFKSTFCRNVDVHFVGVWDTVSSVGAIIPGKALPFSAGSSTVTHFRQALSLDERRVRFLPQPWMPDLVPEDNNIDTSLRDKDHVTTVKELWFAGAHSNVGGGFSDTTMDTVPILAHCSLRWMLRESVEQGLFLNPRALRTSPILIPFVPAAVKACSQTDQSPTNDDGNNAADAGVDDNEDVKISADGSVAVEDQAFILALVTEAARPPASSADAAFVREAALAPRGDSLSFDIPRGPKTSTLRNFKRRLLTSLWWLMEITPTLRVVWDVEGSTRSWSWRLNLGRPRHLPRNPTFHHSVRERMHAQPGHFPPPTGEGGVVEREPYVPKAKFRKGESLKTVKWDDDV